MIMHAEIIKSMFGFIKLLLTTEYNYVRGPNCNINVSIDQNQPYAYACARARARAGADSAAILEVQWVLGDDPHSPASPLPGTDVRHFDSAAIHNA